MFLWDPLVCCIALIFNKTAPWLHPLWCACLLHKPGIAVSELVNASVLWRGQGCRQALSLPAFIPPGVSVGSARGGLGRAPK